MTIGGPFDMGTAAVASSETVPSLTTTATAPVGSLVLLRLGTVGNTGTPTCADTAGNTYVPVMDSKSGTASRPRMTTFVSKLTSQLPSGGVITVSDAVNGTQAGGISAQYFTGVEPTVDVSVGSTVARTSTITPTVPVLLIGAMGYSSTSTYTEAANWASLPSQTAVGTMVFGAYQAGSASVAYGWQPTMGTSRNFAWQIFGLVATSASFAAFGVPL